MINDQFEQMMEQLTERTNAIMGNQNRANSIQAITTIKKIQMGMLVMMRRRKNIIRNPYSLMLMMVRMKMWLLEMN